MNIELELKKLIKNVLNDLDLEEDIITYNKFPPAKLVVFHEPYKGKLLACVLRRINWSSSRILFYLLPLKGSLYSLKLI